MSKHNRERRRFKNQKPSAELAAFIDQITRGLGPEHRAATSEACTAIQADDFLMVFAQSPSVLRASIILALRDAMKALCDNRKCDFCSDRSEHIRFVGTFAGDDFRRVKCVGDQNALVGFIVVCPKCLAKGYSQCQRDMLDVYAEIRPDGAENFYRPTVIGIKVGEATDIPSRREIQDCADCKSPIWIAQDAADLIQGETPLYFCKQCAWTRYQDGRIEMVPEFISA